jgi:small subunit ribosomal protein S9
VEAGASTQNQQYYYGVGRRKSAVARVRLFPGQGNITVNNKSAQEYFGGRDVFQTIISEPLRLTNLFDQFNIQVRVVGGGQSGQAGAIRHAIARALTKYDHELRPALKQTGLLTRDDRVKERKKVGLKRARKAPQYTKR